MAIATPTTTDIDKSALSNQPHSGSPDGSESFSKNGTNTYDEVPVYSNGEGTSSSRANSVNREAVVDLEEVQQQKRGRFAYFKTRDFWIVLVLGQVLSLCITGTNTFTTLLGQEEFSVPAFQTLINYALLTLLYVPYTIFRLGIKGYGSFVWKWGWKFLILSFFDVLGNYFTVLAYQYTTILQAQLINFWAIALVVIVSFLFLKVRYHPAQVAGILICIGGLGIIIGSDHITGATSMEVSRGDQIKGNLFALVGATFYGLANVSEEFLVSKRSINETLGMMGMLGFCINGVILAIFDRETLRNATFSGKIGGYLTGYTLLLTLFYSVGPLVFRMASAAFFNISLLTSNFWGTIIAIHVFGYPIHFMYPIAFVCIVGGLVIYFIGKQAYGEAIKPWLGRNQEKGADGLGTARRKAENPNAIV